jgi:predicted DNA-binding transcriptional regulator AlpA
MMSTNLQPSVSTPDEEYPLTVRQAAKYLGVSPQTVYLWVERKQIPIFP